MTAKGTARRSVFEVEGLCCATEARQIEGQLAGVPGVERLSFDFVQRRLVVEGAVAAVAVERAVAATGMRARPLQRASAPERSWWERHGRLLLSILSGASLALSLIGEHFLGSEVVAGAFAVAAVVAGGWHVFPRAWRAAMGRALDMNFLMSIAAIGALSIREWEEAASVMFLFSVAQLLEARSMDRARNAIRALMDLSPVEATVVRDGRELRVPADQVGIDEVVVVRPGEKLPVDGVVESGHSSVNQAPITGESMPVAKGPGAEVFAGTLNGEGALEVRATRAAEDSTLARILHAVEEAQASRAPSQTFVDRFARVYTPAVVATALGLLVLPPLAGLGTWGEWFYRALVLLVVACPCALVISTPVTIVSALAGAARRGILIKGGLHLENAGRARVVAFDKTGTLTTGTPAVTAVVPLGGAATTEVIRLAAAAERRSEHPLALAIVRHAEEMGLDVPAATDTEALPGRGVRARIDGAEVVVGNVRLLEELGAMDDEVRRALDRKEAEGRTAAIVARGTGETVEPIGVIALADTPRPEAAEALRGLHEAGIERVVMLTGDNARAAATVAASLGGPGRGVDEVMAGLLPADKAAAVRRLRDAHGTLIMVGDGINDAPALAAADVGVAMGAAGTDVALETADIALMADDLSKLPLAIRYARKAEGIIRVNIVFSLALKAAFMALAVLGAATLWMAVLADTGASLLVTANGMRARYAGE